MAFTEKIAKDKCIEEITAWLDYKRVKPSQRELYKGIIDTLVEAMQYGDITIDSSTFVITHTLAFPVASLFESLTYKPRISAGELQKASETVKANDVDGKCLAVIAALSGKGLSLIKQIDSEDNKILQAIAVFFM